jgi:hypothetical protein
VPPPQPLRGGPSKATLVCTPDSFCIKFYASRDQQSNCQIAFKLGFGCSVSHSRKGVEGVRIPGECSSPVKRPTKASPPGVGRWRRRRPRERGWVAEERERERTQVAASRGKP